MSNAVFPKLPGRTWSLYKKATWGTIVQRSTSGKRVAIQTYSSPIWKFSLTYDHIRAREQYGQIGMVPVAGAIINAQQLIVNDFYALQGFINGRQGMWDTWLYDDVDDDYIGQVQIGTGTGASANYQAVRVIGEYTEPLQNLNGSAVLAGTWSANMPVSATSGALILPTLQGIQTQTGLIGLYQTPGWPNYFKCTTAGTTGATEPYWRNAALPGATIIDG